MNRTEIPNPLPAVPPPDWNALRLLRGVFLQEEKPTESYWTSEQLLNDYDRTFAERIGWKWDALLAMLRGRGWVPPGSHVLDWGCGTGVAARKVVQAFAGTLRSVSFHDKSEAAKRFASRRFARACPDARLRETGAPDVLVLSHVLNELEPGDHATLLETIGKAKSVLWVEPGTYADSHRLIAWREKLVEAGWHIAAPCTHRAPCGMLAPPNAKHWCHFFAPVPDFVFHTAFWSAFRRETQVDLGTLPFSCLAAQRDPLPESPVLHRHIGQPLVHKGGAKFLTCNASGVENIDLPRNLDKSLYKTLRREANPSLLRGEYQNRRWQSIEVLEWMDPPASNLSTAPSPSHPVDPE